MGPALRRVRREREAEDPTPTTTTLGPIDSSSTTR